MSTLLKQDRPMRLPILGNPDQALQRAGNPGAGDPAGGEEPLLQVGELARAAGKTVRAIHHYEQLGLLRPDRRSKGRFRLYDPSALARLRWIGKLHDLGLSLTQISELIASWEHAPTAAQAMSAVREMYRERLHEIRHQIANLNSLERELSASVEYLDTCETCDPSVLADVLPPREEEPKAACDACEKRERDAEPGLVTGIVS